MRVDMSIVWGSALVKGRTVVVGSTSIIGRFLAGTGEYDQKQGRFGFANTDLCHMFYAIVLACFSVASAKRGRVPRRM